MAKARKSPARLSKRSDFPCVDLERIISAALAKRIGQASLKF